jgi:Sulfite exporter TauE/SafE
MKFVSGKFLMVGLGTGILAGICAPEQKCASGSRVPRAAPALLPPSGAFAFWQYYRTGNVDLRMAALIFLGLLLGGWAGGGWAQHLSNEALRKGFAVFLVLTALHTWFAN